MSTPSLLNIPYLYKAGTLYSQIPESGAGDFTVTRTTTPVAGQSTRINKNGLIELVADNVPRLDYPLGGAVNGCASLLVEPSAKNDCVQSQGFSTSPWIATGVTVTGTTQTNSPDGTQNAFDITIAGTGLLALRQIIGCANNTTYTVSCFYKNKALVAGQTFEMRYTNENLAPNNLNAIATIDLAAGTATYSLFGTSGTGFSGTATGRVENYGNGWYRVSMTFTVGSAGANVNGIFRPIAGVSISRNFYAWGAQLEVGSVPTSYIPTITQAITRGAEVINKTNIASLIGQSEGTIYWEGAISRIDRVIFSLAQGTSVTNFIYLQTLSNGFFRADVLANNSSTCAILSLATATLGQFYKIAFAYKENDFALYINGVLQGSDNLGALPSGLSNAIFARGDSSLITDQRCRALEVFPNRIPNTAAPGVLSLATLTAL